MSRGGGFYFLEYVTSATKSLSSRRFSPRIENRMSPVVFELTPALGAVSRSELLFFAVARLSHIVVHVGL